MRGMFQHGVTVNISSGKGIEHYEAYQVKASEWADNVARQREWEELRAQAALDDYRRQMLRYRQEQQIRAVRCLKCGFVVRDTAAFRYHEMTCTGKPDSTG